MEVKWRQKTGYKFLNIKHKNMEQETMPNVGLGSGKKPDSKNFLIAIIIVLAVGIVVLGALFLFETREDVPAETEAEKVSTPTDTTTPPVTSNENTTPATTESATGTTATETPALEIKKADLYVKSYTLSENPKVGSEFTATIVIGNKGQAASAESYWEWWATSSKQICKKKVGAIAVGGTSTVQCDYTYTDWSDYTTKAIVDSQNDVDESNENNNVATKAVTPLHGKPDLTITEYDFNHDPVKGEEFKIEITIKNKGETDAGEFKWEYWGASALKLCDGEIDELNADGSTTVTCTAEYGGCSGAYVMKIIADVDDEVNEKNEGNNTYTKTISVPCS